MYERDFTNELKLKASTIYLISSISEFVTASNFIVIIIVVIGAWLFANNVVLTENNM